MYQERCDARNDYKEKEPGVSERVVDCNECGIFNRIPVGEGLLTFTQAEEIAQQFLEQGCRKWAEVKNLQAWRNQLDSTASSIGMRGINWLTYSPTSPEHFSQYNN